MDKTTLSVTQETVPAHDAGHRYYLSGGAVMGYRVTSFEEYETGGQTMIKPIPCRKFKNASTFAWIAKLTEEMDEAVQEAAILEDCADDEGMVDSDKVGIVDVNNRLAMEIMDVITVCVSWLYALGYDESARDRLQRRVNEKNRKRGYHDE